MPEEAEIVLPSGPPVLPPSVPPPPLPPPKPWNGWMTLVWLLAAMTVWMGVQTVFMIFWAIGTGSGFDQKDMNALVYDGDFIGLSTIISAVVACPFCYWVGRWKSGFSGWDYLGLLKMPRPLVVIFWTVATVALSFGFSAISPLFGVEETPEFMKKAVRSSDFLPFMILGVVVGAPLLEEFIFRGMVFRGWRESRMGLWGTLLVTSLIFTLLHAFQYGIVILVWVFLLGMLMGLAREKTGSLWVPIIMHAVNNAVATVGTIMEVW